MSNMVYYLAPIETQKIIIIPIANFLNFSVMVSYSATFVIKVILGLSRTINI